MVKTGKDGRLYTEANPVPVDLAKARRECLDVIAGNVQFHTDPHSVQKPAADQNEKQVTCFCSYLGETCDVCEPGRGHA